MSDIRPAVFPADSEAVRRLFRAYEKSLDGSLAAVLCFQGYEAELAGLPGDYAAPRGALLLASQDGAVIGMAALRGIAPDVGEMKRLYVEPSHRYGGLGAALAKAIITVAERAGYRLLRLDTHVSMVGAMSLYRQLGFMEIPRYYGPPTEGLVYFERVLR